MSGGYPDDWDAIAANVKEAAGWVCEHCTVQWGRTALGGHVHEVVTGYVLTVHHLDGDKSNCADDNLVALCQRCHLHWQKRFVVGQMVMWFARPVWLESRGLGI